jgi:hypothetical protein
VYDKGNFGVPGQIECKRKKNDGEGYWMEREERRCRMCYRVIINVCPIVVGVITRMRLVSPTGGAPGGSGNLSTGLSNVARVAAHPKFVWVFNANCDGTIIYNDPV